MIVTAVGVVVVCSGLHVEVQAVAIRASKKLRLFFEKFKEQRARRGEERERDRQAALSEEAVAMKYAQKREAREQQLTLSAARKNQAENAMPEPIQTNAPSMQPQRVLCPYCSELIAATAVKCRHCNEFLDGRDAVRRGDLKSNHLADSAAGSKTENELWIGHPKMFRNSPVGFVICCALVAASFIFPFTFFVGIGFIVIWWFRCIYTTLTVTTRRTILRTGILAKNTSEVRHQDVRLLEVRQSFTDRIFGVGTIAVASAGTGLVEIQVSGIANPVVVKETIDSYR